MIFTLKSRFKNISLEPVIGALAGATAIAHIPTRFAPGTFDRNAAPQFIFLALTALFSAIYLFSRKVIAISFSLAIAIGALLFATSISLLMSESFLTSLIGDTGRFAGMVSLWALLVIAIAFSQFTNAGFLKASFGATVGIVLVTLLGFFQSFDFISLPTGGGAGSTLGNLDFLSAWIGTTVVLVYLAFKELGYKIWIFAGYLILSLLTLWKIGAKQGPLDLALILGLIILFQLARRAGVLRLSARALKIIATFALLIWSEAIYLIPMAKIKVPGISGDVNVDIRSDFWFSAGQMFLNQFSFGVGPDNFGSYYEKYRSLNSVRTTESVITNDAHSSMMQTFATLGFFATMAFLVLTLLAIYSLINLILREDRTKYSLLLISFIAFYTNSLISPMTLPNKLIFWAIAGFAIGQDLRTREFSARSTLRLPVRALSVVAALAIAIPTALFANSFFSLNSTLSKVEKSESVNYKVSKYLPCIIYTGAQLSAVSASGGDPLEATREILESNPRCLDALGFLANDAIFRKDYAAAKPYIYSLLDVAPARQSVVRLASIYAIETQDKELQSLLSSQGIKLGLISVQK
jgi:O-antigen ligase